MSRFLVCVLMMTMAAMAAQSPSPSTPSDRPAQVTFNKDVLPILQNNCQTCHRPGEIAPMSFLTYESTRPWAKAIKTAVLTRKMPPWFADPHSVELRNAPKLSPEDIATLTAWADTGAREGAPSNTPPSREWAEGWRTNPDVIVSMKEPYKVSATGAGEIKQFIVPNPFKEDTWVSSIEIRPGDPSVVHHVIVQVQEAADARIASLQEALGKAEAARGQVLREGIQVSTRIATADLPQGQSSYSDVLARMEERRTGLGAFMTMEAVYAPGTSPLDFRFHDSAKLVHAGQPLRIEVHYTPNGKDTLDQTKVGFTLAKNPSPAPRRFVIMAPEHLVDTRKPIPAGETNWETTGELKFNQDAELVWFMPHMHLRGKDMTFRLIYPDGREETALSAKFDFHWQLGYEVENPIHVTKGTKMIVTAHHDNSANNPLNPAPDLAVPWGDLTSQEMMLPWFGVVVDNDARPAAIASYKPAMLDGPLNVTPPIKVLKPNGVVTGTLTPQQEGFLH
jgi:hypothetical protein